MLAFLIGTFSYSFFRNNCKPQTSKYHMSLALLSHLMFAVRVFTAGISSSSKWNTAEFLGNLNLTIPRLRLSDWFLHI